MNSKLVNRHNLRPESLDKYSDFLTITEDISGQVIQGRTAGFFFAIDPQRQYEINRIDLTVNIFRTIGPPIVYVFPRFEGFSLVCNFNGKLARDSGGLNVDSNLFSGLLFSTTDGTTSTHVFYEPFIFTNTKEYVQYLCIGSADAGSVFTGLTGIAPFPPVPPDAVLIEGLMTIEGVSYDIDTARKLGRPYNQ